MAYIGKTPLTGNFVKIDSISVVNGQASYTMNNGGSAFTDYENVNQFLVSLNGILQAPTTSFTVSGSTLTFASNLATGDVIDFVIVLGNTLDIGTPSDATVTQAKTNFVSTSSSAGLQIKGDGTTDGTLQLNCRVNSHGIKLKSPPHSAGQSYTLTFPSTAPQADKALITDGSGNLSFASAGEANTPAFQATMSANTSMSDATYTKIAFNTETFDTAGAYDHSTNYRFTPQTAGKYFIYGRGHVDTVGNIGLQHRSISIYKNGSEVHRSQWQEQYTSGLTNAGSLGTISAVIDMNGSSDYVELYAYVDYPAGFSITNTRVVALDGSVKRSVFGGFLLTT